MDILGKIKAVPRTVRAGLPALQYGRGGWSYLVNKGERYVGAAVFGAAKGLWREKAGFHVRGHFIPYDIAVGTGLTLIGAGLTVASQGRSRLASHLDAVGDAGVMSFIGSVAAAWGAKTAGREVYVLDKGAKPQIPAGLSKQTWLAGLPLAEGGACLTDEDIAAALSKR